MALGAPTGIIAGLGLHRIWAEMTGGPVAPQGHRRSAFVAAAVIVGMGSGAVADAGWPTMAASVVLGGMLLLLATLDITHFWLPDRLTVPLGAAGLVAQAMGIGPGLASGVLAMALGFGALWLVGAVYRAVRGHEGLGGGDPKMLAAIGAWLAPESLPWVVLLAALLGIAVTAFGRVAGRSAHRFTRLPFGALMAAAAWPLWLGGQLA